MKEFLKSFKNHPADLVMIGAPVAAVGLYAATSLFQSHGSKIRKHGTVKKNPRSEEQLNNSRNAVLAGASYAVSRRFLKLPVNTSLGVALGILGTSSLHSRIIEGKPFGQSFVQSGLITAAALGAFLGGRTLSTRGLTSLASFAKRTKAKETFLKMEEAIENAKAKFPLLSGVINSELAGNAALIASVPVTHNIINKALYKYSRQSTNHADIALNPSIADNQAGYDRQRTTREPDFAPANSSPTNINWSGTLMSHYDTEYALDNL